MFDGHTLAEPVERFQLRSAPAAQTTPHIVQTIAPILSPYLWKMSLLLGIGFAGLSVPVFPFQPDLSELPAMTVYNCIVIAMRVFGGFGFLCYLVAACYEAWHFERQWTLHAEERRAKLPAAPKQEIHLTIDKQTPTGFHQESRTIEQVPRSFIVDVYGSAHGDNRRIPGERFFEDRYTAAADRWLDVLQAEGFLSKSGDARNSFRCINPGVTLTEMLARFGHSLPAPDNPLPVAPHPVPAAPQRTAPEAAKSVVK